MQQGRALLLEIWKKLDYATIQVMDSRELGNDADKAAASARARAYADTLALFMPPFFDNADDIVREAVKRYKADQAGTDHVTPGLAEHIWNPTKNWDGTERVLPGVESKPRKKTEAKQTTLQPQQIEFIKKALADGIMQPAALAGMFKVSQSVVEQYRA